MWIIRRLGHLGKQLILRLAVPTQDERLLLCQRLRRISLGHARRHSATQKVGERLRLRDWKEVHELQELVELVVRLNISELDGEAGGCARRRGTVLVEELVAEDGKGGLGRILRG